MSQYPAVVDLADLDGSNGVRLMGEAEWNLAGYSVNMAGDINGDGFADLMIGASSYSRGEGEPLGKVYVVYGTSVGLPAQIDLASLTPAQGFHIDSIHYGEIFGQSVAAAGDVNGDGREDMIISGPNFYGQPTGGSSYVVFGSADGFACGVDLTRLDGSNGFRILDDHPHTFFEGSVAGAGDINGDGYADLIVGSAGSSAVIFGKASGFDANLDLDDLDGSNGFRFQGASDPASSAGDVNGDGLDDIVLGDWKTDTAYVIYGRTSGFPADLTNLTPADGFAIYGEKSDDELGVDVASAGDVNGDGVGDIIVGALGADPHGFASGSSYVVFGRSGGFGSGVNLGALNGSNGFEIDGDGVSFSGCDVASAGDVNGDGFDDVVVRSGQKDFVVFGAADGFTPALDLASLDGSNGFVVEGKTGILIDNQNTGVTAGDFNGDGLSDLAFGEPCVDGAGHYSGAVYVLYGQLPDASVSRVGTDASQTLVGGDFDDRLLAKGGADKLYGHDGFDILHAGTGDDTLVGGGGADRLKGGLGADVFVYTAVSDSTVAGEDQITSLDASDRIDLSAIDADINTSADDAFIQVQHFHGQAGELLLKYNVNRDVTFLKADVDGDGHADLVLQMRGEHLDFAGLVL